MARPASPDGARLPDLAGGVVRTLVLVLVPLPVAAGLAFLWLPALGWMPGLAPYAGAGLPITDLFAEPGMLRSALIHLWTGLAATLLSVGFTFLLIAAGAGTGWFSRVNRMMPALLSLPHASAAFGAILVLASSGLIARLVQDLTGLYPQPPDWRLLHDPAGLLLILVMAFKEIPFLLLLGVAGLSGLPVRDSRLQMGALGYGRIAGFLLVLGAPLYARLRLPVLIVLAYCVSVSDLAILIGPNLPQPLSVRIVAWLADPDLRWRYLAAAGSLMLVVLAGVSVLIWMLIEKAAGAACRHLLRSGQRFQADRAARLLAGFVATALGFTGLVFYGLLALWSVARAWRYPALVPDRLTLDNWRDGLVALSAPLSNTLLMASASAGLSLVLAVLLLWFQDRARMGVARDARTWPDPVLLPLLLPQVAIVSGLQLALLVLKVPVSLPVLIVAHMIFVFPYLYLSLSGPWRGLDIRYEQLARSFGRSAVAILLRVRLPLLLAPLLSSLALGFAVSTALYVPTVVLGSGRITSVVTEAVALGSGGDRRMMGVYGLLQALLALLPFALAVLVPALCWRHRRGMTQE